MRKLVWRKNHLKEYTVEKLKFKQTFFIFCFIHEHCCLVCFDLLYVLFMYLFETLVLFIDWCDFALM